MELKENDIIANGIRLHYYRTNAHKPPLVFAHGMSDNGLCFRPIAEQFSDEYEIVLYDSRNHGKSEAPAASSLLDRANDLAGLIAGLELANPKVIGHSLGAVTVALLAGLYPGVPACAVLEDPVPFEVLAAEDEQAQSFDNAWRAKAAADKQKSIDELVAMNRRESPVWPEAERRPWALAKQQFNLKAFDEENLDAPQGNAIVSQITCPVLILTGSPKKGSLYPPAAADTLAASMPNVTHVNIPGAGHNIRREQPAAYLKALRDFLSST